MYSRINHSKSYMSSLYYVLDAPAHDGSEQRNLLVFPIGLVDGSAESYYSQFGRLMKRKANSRNIYETRMGILSFSQNELNPDSEESVVIISQIANDICREGYDGFPAICAIQNDNDSHTIHAHIIWANVHVEAGRGFSDEQSDYSYLRELFDKTAARYGIVPDKTTPVADKLTQAEYNRRKENEEIKSKNATRPVSEQEPLLYIWRDDLKKRIRAAMSEATNRDDYLERLKMHGVTAEYKNTKKNGDFILYELKDKSGFKDGKVPENLKAKSYKLGTDFDLEALDAEILMNQKMDIMNKDIPEPVSSQEIGEREQLSVATAVPAKDDIGSTSYEHRPRRSYKTRGKNPKGISDFEKNIVVDEPRRKLPKRNNPTIARMTDILNKDIEEVTEMSGRDFSDIIEELEEARNVKGDKRQHADEPCSSGSACARELHKGKTKPLIKEKES